MSACFLYNRCNHKDCDKPFCLRRYKMEKLFEASLIPEAKWAPIKIRVDSDLTDKDKFEKLKSISQNITSFVNSGTNLYLHSANCGNGKTTWALRFAFDYINTIWPQASLDCKVLFVSVPKLLLALKDDIAKKSEYVSYIKKNVATADLVIWDDIAAKVGTEFELTHLFNFIDDRLARRKSNIYTSNLNSTEMADAVAERLRSRICFENVIDIELKGADKRFLSE